LVQGQNATVHVTLTNNTGQPAYLNAWIDFDQQYGWSDDNIEKNRRHPESRVDFPVL